MGTIFTQEEGVRTFPLRKCLERFGSLTLRKDRRPDGEVSLQAVWALLKGGIGAGT